MKPANPTNPTNPTSPASGVRFHVVFIVTDHAVRWTVICDKTTRTVHGSDPRIPGILSGTVEAIRIRILDSYCQGLPTTWEVIDETTDPDADDTRKRAFASTEDGKTLTILEDTSPYMDDES